MVKKSFLRYLGEFLLFLTLFYILHFTLFSQVYLYALLIPSFFIATLFDMSLQFNFANLEEIRFLSDGVMINPITSQQFKPSFILSEGVLQESSFLLFKLPLILAIIFTFARTVKLFLTSMVILASLQLFFITALILDLALFASTQDRFLQIYFQSFGVESWMVGLSHEFKTFIFAWLQKFTPFLFGYYLWVKGDFGFAFNKIGILKKRVLPLSFRSLKVKK